jgi:hypothetical protein
VAKPIDPSKFIARGGSKPISRRVLVGGTLQSAWVVVPFATAAILAAVGVLLYFRTDIPYVLALVPLGLLAAIPGAIAAAIQLARRRWMEVTPNGFTLIRRDGSRRTYDDEQIIGITQRLWPRSDGSWLRRVVIDVASDDGGDTIDCFYHIEANKEDPLFSLVDRNARALAQRTSDNLEQGARLSGTGWHYDRDGLHVHHGPRRGTYPLDDLTYIAFFDAQIKIYRGTETEPLFCISDASRNAHTLGQYILWGTMEKRPTVNDPLPDEPLGRHMHTIRGWDDRAGWTLLVLSGLALVGFVTVGLLHEQTVMLVLGGMCLPLVGLGLWLVLRASYMRIKYHQFGVAQPGRGRSLLFNDLGAMNWTGTDIRLEPLPGAPGQVILFQTTGYNYSNDRVTIRDYIASKIAERWGKEMANGPVQWTKNLRFLPDKLEYLPAGIFGKGEPVAVPYHITSYYLIQTWMELFVQGESRMVLKQPINAMNFWPGLILLNWIYASLREQAQSGQQQTALPKFKMPGSKPDDRFTTAQDNVKPAE